MLVNAEEAERAYERLPYSCKAPAMKPCYVIADAARDPSASPCFFVYQENEHLYYHAFHVIPIPGTDLFDVQSPYGCGGPVLSSASSSFSRRAAEAYVSWCMDNRILAEFIRFHPLLGNDQHYHGHVIDDRQTVFVDLLLKTGPEFRQLTKRNIRTAQKNGLRVSLRNGPDWMETFRPLYGQLMEDRMAPSFYHFPSAYFDALSAQPHAFYFTCSDGESDLAAAMFLVTHAIAEYHLGATSERGRQIGAMSLLMSEAIDYFNSISINYLHLGGGTNGHPANPLLFFKMGFSKQKALFRIGKRVYRPELYDKMLGEWEKTNGRKPNQVLFYRF